MPTLSQSQYKALRAKNLSDEDIKAIAKKKGYSLPDTRGFFPRLASDFAQRGERIVSEFGDIAPAARRSKFEGTLEAVQAFGRTAGQVAGGASDIITEALPSAIRTGLGNASERALQTNVGKKITSFLQAHPEFTKDFETALNVGSLVGAKTFEKFGTRAVSKTSGVAGKQLTKTGSAIQRGVQQRNIDAALELTKPFQQTETSVAAKAYLKTAQATGRVNKKFGFGYKVKPSDFDKKVAESVADFVTPDKNPFEIQQAVKTGIGRLANDNRAVLGSVKAIFPKKELKKFITQNIDDAEHKVLFAGEKQARKAYDAVVDALYQNVPEGNLQSLKAGIEKFDDIVDPYLDKLRNKFGASLVDDVKLQAVQDVRRGAKDFLIEKMKVANPQASKAFETTLNKEFLMYEGIKRMEKNGLELLKRAGAFGAVGAFIKNHPVWSFGLATTLATGSYGVIKTKDLLNPITLLTILAGGSVYLGNRLFNSRVLRQGLAEGLKTAGNKFTEVERKQAQNLIQLLSK